MLAVYASPVPYLVPPTTWQGTCQDVGATDNLTAQEARRVTSFVILERSIGYAEIVVAIAALAALTATTWTSARVTDAMIENDVASTGDVLSWGMGTRGLRHSPSTKINVSNVANLVPVWSFSFGVDKQPEMPSGKKPSTITKQATATPPRRLLPRECC